MSKAHGHYQTHKQPFIILVASHSFCKYTTPPQAKQTTTRQRRSKHLPVGQGFLVKDHTGNLQRKCCSTHCWSLAPWAKRLLARHTTHMGHHRHKGGVPPLGLSIPRRATLALPLCLWHANLVPRPAPSCAT